MELDTEVTSVENTAVRETIACEENSFLEPDIGMEFDSEDAAKQFYDEYARRVGFIMRIDQCRRSEVDKRILSRRLSCNKQGYYVKTRDQYGPATKPRTSMREGCKAMMLVKVNKEGKWVVTRFVKEHSHPLVVSGRPSRDMMDHKDRRIQVLTMELQHQNRLCDLYRSQLLAILQGIEDQTELLSEKIKVTVNNVTEIERGYKIHQIIN